jgi:hypothetical protein
MSTGYILRVLSMWYAYVEVIAMGMTLSELRAAKARKQRIEEALRNLYRAARRALAGVCPPPSERNPVLTRSQSIGVLILGLSFVAFLLLVFENWETVKDLLIGLAILIGIGLVGIGPVGILILIAISELTKPRR